MEEIVGLYSMDDPQNNSHLRPISTVHTQMRCQLIDIEELQKYLNSGDARAWFEANCQRAANGFLRLQSTVMKQLPVPEHFGEHRQSTLTAEMG
jgi:hypothetical protein